LPVRRTANGNVYIHLDQRNLDKSDGMAPLGRLYSDAIARLAAAECD
jgi:hypothetical protein